MPMLLFNVIFDTFFTFVRRCIRHENVFQPHNSHLYQLFQRAGYTHLEVSLIHYCFCFLQGLGALWMVQIPGNTRLYVFVPFLLLQIVYATQVMKMVKRKGLLYCRCRKSPPTAERIICWTFRIVTQTYLILYEAIIGKDISVSLASDVLRPQGEVVCKLASTTLENSWQVRGNPTSCTLESKPHVNEESVFSQDYTGVLFCC